MIKQVEAGRKADLTLRYAWGPDERNRMARAASWTKDNPGQPPENNPHAREKIYSEDERYRAVQFEMEQEKHPETDPADNPHIYPAMKKRETQ